MDQNAIAALTRRLVGVRASLLTTHPFFGRLLLHLRLGYAGCGTAFTDMKRIVFDPAFALSIGDDELRFIFLHEVMHCVLHHCTRGRTFRPFVFNVACDIVVNSLIMESLGVESFKVAGVEAMHLVPDGREGRLFSAEQVYEMLIKSAKKPPADNAIAGSGEDDEDGAEGQLPDADPPPDGDGKKTKSAASGAPAAGNGLDEYQNNMIDNHDPWEKLSPGEEDDRWDQFVKDAGKRAGSVSGIPYGLRRYLREISHTPKTNWRQLLHDFIRHDRSDYTFQIPDRRFQDGVILPSFCDEVYGEKVERLWFAVDTSGSISDEALTEAFEEIKDALDQIDDLSGELSFFDYDVTAPVEFSNVEDLSEMKPVGGGGTSFAAIFERMSEFYKDELPVAIIIITDGYAPFPDESAARDVPVMWIVIDSSVEAPWGECVHIESEEQE